MTVLITLTTAGTDSGPFDLYSNLDGYTSAFESGVSKASLLAGYSSSAVPDYTSIIRVLSTGDCTNYIDITLDAPSTTTTSSSSTTTTTTTLPPIFPAGISGTPNTFDGCATTLDTVCWVSNIGGTAGAEITTSSSVAYANSSGTILFPGLGGTSQYKIKITGSSVCTSNAVASNGDVTPLGAICASC